jgi:hypothetical protein
MFTVAENESTAFKKIIFELFCILVVAQKRSDDYLEVRWLNG